MIEAMANGAETLDWNTPELRSGVRVVAITRLAAIPLFATVGLTETDVDSRVIVALASPWIVWQLVQLRWFLGLHWQNYPLPWLLALDVAAIGAGVAASGGAESQMRWLALLIMFIPTCVLPPRQIAVLSLFMVFCVGTPVLIDGHADRDALVFIGAGLAVVILNVSAAAVRQESTRLLRAATARQRELLAVTTSTEANKRRQVSQELHDTALQTLLAAQQDLDEAVEGDAEALAFVRAGLRDSVAAVRTLVEDMDSSPLAGSVLPAALGSLAVRTMAANHIHINTELDPEATGEHDDLLYDVVRSLIDRALADGAPSVMTLTLGAGQGRTVLTLVHDGPEPSIAAQEVVTARIETVGGTVRMMAGIDGETGVRISVPNGSGGDAPAAVTGSTTAG
jgi:two-component system NarL family sensor kinase